MAEGIRRSSNRKRGRLQKRRTTKEMLFNRALLIGRDVLVMCDVLFQRWRMLPWHREPTATASRCLDREIESEKEFHCWTRFW